MTVAPHFQFKNGALHAEDISLAQLATTYGTPLYVYSRQALHDAWEAYRIASEGRDVLVCYGMKANSNLAVLNEFKNLGTGFDIVSGGELARVLRSEEHTSELQSLMRISYAVFCLKKKTPKQEYIQQHKT